jgi:4-amino-4-deoxy-L-arabinose transferase-like glycosyltransferase
VNRNSRLLLAPIFLVLLGFFWVVARHRFIDADEGFYLMASRLVLQHKAPYVDFFYQQTPLLPYAYALWMKVFGVSWLSARTFTALLTAILGLLVFEAVCRETHKCTAGFAAVALYASNSYVIARFSIARTFSLAALLLFGAYTIVSWLGPKSPAWAISLAGLLFGLSVNTSLFVAGAAPFLFGWVFHRSEKREGLIRILWFSLGFTLGIGQALYLVVGCFEK